MPRLTRLTQMPAKKNEQPLIRIIRPAPNCATSSPPNPAPTSTPDCERILLRELAARSSFTGRPSSCMETTESKGVCWCMSATTPGTCSASSGSVITWSTSVQSSGLICALSWISVISKSYCRFMDDDGYNIEHSSWTPEGRKWLQQQGRTAPYFWGDTRYNGPTQPVAGNVMEWMATSIDAPLKGAVQRFQPVQRFSGAVGDRMKINGQ
jgi:hypothetical protein